MLTQQYITTTAAVKPAQVYRCRYCPHLMVQTTTPAGEPCVACLNPACRWTVHAACADILEPVAEEESSLYAELIREEALRATISAFEPALMLWL